MTPKKLDNKSVDGSQLNLEALYAIAPSCFTEVKDPKTGEMKQVVNFDTLRTLLGDDAVENDREMYQFTWPGKQAARLEAAAETTETLRPVPEDSVNWDTTENLYIEGDNLRVLKLLQKSYLGKVKMIYIDPPYNTGNDFVYHDDFARSTTAEELAAGNIDLEGKRYRKNTNSNGRFHSDWCSMMLSRLLVAHSLLTEDGVIFISIDDNEVHNLRKICDEVFGERNLIAEVIVNRTSEVATNMTVQKHEYCIVYAKQVDCAHLCGNQRVTVSRGTVGNIDQTTPIIEFPAGLKCLNISDGVYTNSRQIQDSRENIEVITPFIVENGVLKKEVKLKARWRSSNDMRNFFANSCLPTPAKINGMIEEIYFDGDRLMPYIKKVVTEKLPTLYLDNQRGSRDLERLSILGFDFPKSVSYLRVLTSLFTSKEDLILDFFSGSATTAHAVMQLNAEDINAGKEGKRKYICVQLAETTPEDSEARKAGYTTIPEIAKERIRRAGKKIVEENPEVAEGLDTGFRVFKLDSSNYEEVSKTPNEYDQAQLDLFLDNIKTDRTDLDLLFGAMLSWGVPLSLSQPLQTEVVDGCTIYNVTDGELVACFAEEVTEEVVQAMAAMQPERVLFRDSCFAEDKMKINLFELFKQQLDWDEREALDNIRVI
ncbi:site-specific DNA-methyltransferase [Porphyromonas gingivalis]|uniref:site-specific DNA-methyltransferase n=1 Tax=Porphyromonas gingivalis TaxID=837 RepID=UPI0024DF67D9|nr:site-specific DNA-methyltransferase [Porphyromonas gingivalis]WIM92340.1 site-specific DNA-methyltransferase [Porphyromonas gingivalis]